MSLTIAFALTLLVAAQAEPSELEDAKMYFEAGKQAYEQGDYQAAAAAFEEAQNLSPRAAIVFSIAQAYRQQYFMDRDVAKLRRAAKLYADYLAQMQKGGRRNDAVQHLADVEQQLARIDAEARAKGLPAGEAPVEATKTQLMVSSRTPGAMVSIDGAEAQEAPLIQEATPGKHAIRVDAEGYLTNELSGVAVEHRLVVVEVNLRAKPAVIRLSAPDGASVAIDGRPLGIAPLLRPILVSAGDHFIAVTDRGKHSFVRDLKLDRGQELSLVASLESTVQRDVSYYFMGAGAALFAATGVTVLVALASEGQARLIQRKLEDLQMNLTIDERDEYNRLRDRRGDMLTVSSLLLAGSVALGVSGGLLYFLDTPGVQSPRSLSVSTDVITETSLIPLVSEDGIGASLMGSF